MNEEKLSFVVTLSATFWEKRPQFSIWFDDHQIIQSEIPDTAQHPFSFEQVVNEGPHTLKIRLENKADTDTVTKDNQIVKDMLLNIDDIVIDDISLGELIWSSEYKLDKPHEYQGEIINHLDRCVNLGWNGTYILNFTSPFYIWLLENL